MKRSGNGARNRREPDPRLTPNRAKISLANRNGGLPMRGVLVLLAFVAATASPVTGQGPAAAGPAPSFDCAAAATGVEHLICADAELSALDRGIAIFYASARRGARAARVERDQGLWLHRDRGICAVRACLVESMTRRLGDLAEEAGRDVPTYSDEDADATLVIAALGGDWYAFGVIGYWHGPTINSAEARGVFRLERDRGEIPAVTSEDCGFSLLRLPRDRWRIVAHEPPSGAACGGMNATVEGTYRRTRR